MAAAFFAPSLHWLFVFISDEKHKKKFSKQNRNKSELWGLRFEAAVWNHFAKDAADGLKGLSCGLRFRGPAAHWINALCDFDIKTQFFALLGIAAAEHAPVQLFCGISTILGRPRWASHGRRLSIEESANCEEFLNAVFSGPLHLRTHMIALRSEMFIFLHSVRERESESQRHDKWHTNCSCGDAFLYAPTSILGVKRKIVTFGWCTRPMPFERSMTILENFSLSASR